MLAKSADEFNTLTVDVEGTVCVVTLNKPDSLNTITLHMHDELTRVWPVLSELEAIRCVILPGAGRAFTAGGDVKAMSEGLAAPALASESLLRHQYDIPMLFV